MKKNLKTGRRKFKIKRAHANYALIWNHMLHISDFQGNEKNNTLNIANECNVGSRIYSQLQEQKTPRFGAAECNFSEYIALLI
jgi:hypothetical protein